ncbi:MAG: ribosome biogenesis GTP-binding protein YihA/YsxC [Rhodobacteraceae bacterium]|nr:ribosome biogenesis GTP-binding protein YihA/YsxC [Paracoccaceae bacterium]
MIEAYFAEQPGKEQAAAGRRLFENRCGFLLSAPALVHLPPPERPEVCFAGRSNVGKSSLINALAGRRNLARSSNTPGRTREINIFSLGDSHYLADLPGYGYAKMSKNTARRAADLTQSYVSGRPSLRRVFLLIDGRRGPMPIDDGFMSMLDESGVSYQLVVTKLDKVSKSGAERLDAGIGTAINHHPAALPSVIGVSAASGTGIPTLRAAIAGIA